MTTFRKILLSSSGKMKKLVGNDETLAFPSSTGSASNIYWQLFTAELTGLLKEFRIKAANSNSVRLALYSDVASAPDALIGYTASTPVSAGQWNKLIAQIPVTSGQQYWIAIQMSVNSTIYRQDSGGTTKYKTYAYADPFPDPAPALSLTSAASWAIAGWG
jgi:hypothetical protein